MSITIKIFFGKDIDEIIDEIAHLRIVIFREFPYLYDGNLEYERNYLANYAKSEKSIIIAAYDGDKIIGISSGIPMTDETIEFYQPFVEQKYDINKIFYCGETILLSQYRGKGIYKQFMQAREDHARKIGGFEVACFCAVERPQNHSLCPSNYQPLNEIWNKFGYFCNPDLYTYYSWKDIDSDKETKHRMTFWLKNLKASHE